jgi:hypothetical protein
VRPKFGEFFGRDSSDAGSRLGACAWPFEPILPFVTLVVVPEIVMRQNLALLPATNSK